MTRTKWMRLGVSDPADILRWAGAQNTRQLDDFPAAHQFIRDEGGGMLASANQHHGYRAPGNDRFALQLSCRQQRQRETRERRDGAIARDHFPRTRRNEAFLSVGRKWP